MFELTFIPLYMFSKCKYHKSLLSVLLNPKDLRLYCSLITLTVSTPKCKGIHAYMENFHLLFCVMVYDCHSMLVVYVVESFCNISEICFCSYIHFINIILKFLIS